MKGENTMYKTSDNINSGILPFHKNKKTIGQRLTLFFKKDWWKIFREGYLWINIVLMIFPLLFMFLTATKTNAEFLNDPFAFAKDFPGTLVENLKMVISGKIGYIELTPFFTMLFNTLIVT